LCVPPHTHVSTYPSICLCLHWIPVCTGIRLGSGLDLTPEKLTGHWGHGQVYR
jgi:hypothetical protein